MPSPSSTSSSSISSPSLPTSSSHHLSEVSIFQTISCDILPLKENPKIFVFCILLVCVFLSLFSFAVVQDRYLSPVAVTVILSHWIKLVSSDFIVMVLVFGIFLFSLCSFWNFSFLIIFPPLFCFFLILFIIIL